MALVTGAGGGIGRAVVRALSQVGHRVVAVDRDRAALEHLDRAVGHCEPIVADVGDGGQIAQVVDEVERERGPIEVAVSVAGILRPATLLDARDDDWRQSFAVNTDGPWHLARSVGRHMVARRRGVIVLVGSNAATVPRIGMGAYAASKAAATMMMRCLGLELARDGVRCNIVSPGSTDTPMHSALWPAGEAAHRSVAGSAEHFRIGIPLGRVADPVDIADAVVFLSSSRARHITMQDLVVDGGAGLVS